MIQVSVQAYDRLGLLLVAACAGWLIICAAMSDRSPWPAIALLVLTGLAYSLGRRLGRRGPRRVAGALAVGVLAIVLVRGPAALTGGALAPPLGYGNANGALYVLGVAAATIVARTTDDARQRRFFWVLAGALAFCAVATSKAATILAAGILTTALLVDRLRRWAEPIAPLLVAGCVVVSVVVGATGGLPAVPTTADLLSQRRADLWKESLEITAEQPIFGVGPGGFAEASPTARSDRDARWAHSEYLQAAAETGVPGVASLVALLIWTYGGLCRSTQDRRIVILATAALTAIAVHASVDYVLHFGSIPVLAALLVGSASSTVDDRRPPIRTS